MVHFIHFRAVFPPDAVFKITRGAAFCPLALPLVVTVGGLGSEQSVGIFGVFRLAGGYLAHQPEQIVLPQTQHRIRQIQSGVHVWRKRPRLISQLRLFLRLPIIVSRAKNFHVVDKKLVRKVLKFEAHVRPFSLAFLRIGRVGLENRRPTGLIPAKMVGRRFACPTLLCSCHSSHHRFRLGYFCKLITIAYFIF